MIVVIPTVIMVMGIERATFAEIQLDQPVAVHQRDRCRVGRDALNRFFQEGFKIVAHPEHQISILKLLCLRRLE